MKNILSNVSKIFNYFHHFHPEVALRYLPLVRMLNKDPHLKTILEIGSGGLGIAPYLKKPVTGVDTDFLPPYDPLLTKIKGSAVKLPLKNNSYDAVICVDMLEHISEGDRDKAIREMLRVARKKMIIAFPSGREAAAEDKYLSAYYLSKFGSEYPFLKEHLKYGLPDVKSICGIILKQAEMIGKKVLLQIRGNENIYLHRFLLKGFMTKSRIIDFIFRKAFLVLIPVFRLLNMEPNYRKIVIIDII